MITAIRRSFKSRIYKIILWIIIAALAVLFSGQELLKMGAKASWFAQVNKQTISRNDYMRQAMLHEDRIRALRVQFGPQADLFLKNMGMSLNPKLYAQDVVIQEALLNQAIQQLRLSISYDYIAEKLSNPLFVRQELAEIIPLEAFDQTGNIDSRILHRYLQRMGLTTADFEQKIAEILARRTLLNILNEAAFVPQSFLDHQYTIDNARKGFSIATISFERVLQEEKKNSITECDLKAFFDKNNATSKKYFVPEKRSGLEWRIAAADYGIEVTEREIEDYYENNKIKLYVETPAQVQVRHILIKSLVPADRQTAKEKAERIRSEAMKDPKQFALIASKESDDKGQVERGGLMPWFKRGEKEAAFDKAAFTLKENGDISQVIPTSQGFEIIQRIDKKPAVYKSLSSVKKEIVTSLVDQKFGEKFAREMRGIIENSKNAGSNLQKMMEEKGLKPKKLSSIVKEDKDWGRVLFGLHTKNDADAYIDNGVGVVVQLIEVQNAYLPTLDSIKDVVSYDLHEDRAAQKVTDLSKEAFEKAKVQDLASVKKEFNLELTNIALVSKSDSQALALLKKKNLPVDQLFQLEKIGAIGTSHDGRNGYVYRLDEIESISGQASQKQKEEMRSSLEREQNSLFTAGFVASLYRSAKIEISQSFNDTEYSIAYED
jgi:parvulin-like peptidyl-prolyl isomerase